MHVQKSILNIFLIRLWKTKCALELQNNTFNIFYTYIQTTYKQKHKFHSIYPENPWTCLSSYFLTEKNQKFKKGSSM